MRDNLGRNCSLVDNEDRNDKQNIMNFDRSWTPEQTLSKLQEMSKNSNFKGF